MDSSITQLLRQTYQTLRSETDLSPHNPVVNSQLSALVQELSVAFQAGSNAHELSDLAEERAHLPHLCSQAECAMEKYWASYFLQQAQPNLTEFWYYDNYCAHWVQETACLGPVAANGRLVFLGSGALPMTALIATTTHPHTPIICVDYDAQACTLSQELIQRLQLTDHIQIVHSTAQEFPYHATDTVLCASLIEGKTALYPILHTVGVEQVLVRDAEGVYCYLYKPSDLPSPAFYTERQRIIPAPKFINTSRIFQRVS